MIRFIKIKNTRIINNQSSFMSIHCYLYNILCQWCKYNTQYTKHNQTNGYETQVCTMKPL